MLDTDTRAEAATQDRRRADDRSPLALGALALLALALGVRTAEAQEAPAAPRSSHEFVISSGSLTPTGAQRAIVKRADLTVAQLSYLLGRRVAVTGSLGWARSRDLLLAGEPKLDIFTYDVGAELRASEWMTRGAVTFSPFVGAGAGARSYDYRKLDVDATHDLAAYGSVGGELGYRRVRLRVEARDYATGFKPLSVGGARGERNDVALLVGFRIVRR